MTNKKSLNWLVGHDIFIGLYDLKVELQPFYLHRNCRKTLFIEQLFRPKSIFISTCPNHSFRFLLIQIKIYFTTPHTI